jgi:hypothetical protein
MSIYSDYQREPSRQRQCMHHSEKNGTRCRSTAMHNEIMCFHHRSDDIPTVLQNDPFEIVNLRDRPTIQRALADIAARLACNHMDFKRASLLLQTLQLAAYNLTAHEQVAARFPATPPEADPAEAESSLVSSDGLPFGGEVFVEGIVRQGFEAGDDALCVQDGSGHRGVSMGIAEEGFDGGLAEGVVAAGDDLVEVDKADVFSFGDGLSPAAVGGGTAVDFAIRPDLAGDERAEDRSSALGLCIRDVLAHVPAEGVDGIGGSGSGVGDVEGLFANARQAAPPVGTTGSRSGTWCWRRGAGNEPLIRDGSGAGHLDAAVVMTELDEDEVTGLDQGKSIFPVTLRDVSVAGEAADGSIDDVDFGRVEEIGDGRTPSPETIGASAMAVADGGIADKDERRKIGIRRASKTKPTLLSGGIGRGTGLSGRNLLRGDGEERHEAGEGSGEQGGVGARSEHEGETEG